MDFLASEPQYVHHLGPLWQALGREGGCWYHGEAARGAWAAVGAQAEPWRGTSAPLVVASGQDFAKARRAHVERIAFIEHGCGQSYGGDPRTARHSAYAGGDGRDAASLVLAPNETSAARWRDRYPQMPVHVIGATRLLPPPAQPGTPVLAVAFHWSSGSREHMSALAHYRPHLAPLGNLLPTIGHAHPRFARVAERVFAQAGIEYVADIEEVARRATVFAVDNSSTLWEMAVHRPVIAMNAPWYRRNVHHGLRFWSHVPGWQVDDGEQLLRVARHLLYVGETGAEWRRRMLITSEVIPRFDGAQVGATLLATWAGE